MVSMIAEHAAEVRVRRHSNVLSSMFRGQEMSLVVFGGINGPFVSERACCALPQPC
jgi:hypothetical protein